MTLVIKDRVKETTTTTGTGSISLGGAVTKFITFSSVLSNADTTYYAIEHEGSDNEFEVGIGTYTSSGNTLTRTTILASSNSNNAVNFSAGTKNIFMTYPADKAVYEDASGNITIPGTIDGRDLATDGTKLDGIAASANNYVHPNHSGEVTSTGDGAMVIADNVVDEANLKVSNSPTNGYVLTAQSGNTGGLTWAAASGGGGGDPDLFRDNASSATTPSATGTNAVAIGSASVASGLDCIAIGTDSSAVNNYGISIGAYSDAAGNNTGMAIGYAADANSTGAMAIGKMTSATGNTSSAIGNAAVTNGVQATAITDSYASGADSLAAAIATNTSSYGASGANSIAIGDLAKATNSNAVCISNTSTASASNSAVLGGSSGTASADGSVALGGSSNVADGIYSTAKGYYGNANGIRLKHATGVYPNQQGAYYVLGHTTSNATPIALNTSVWTPNATNQVVLPNNSAYAFHGTIVARQKAGDGTASAAWKVEGLIRREGSAGTTVLVNSATTVLDNTPSWGMALSADTTNGCLKIEATGAASTNIRWVASIHTSEVTYA